MGDPHTCSPVKDINREGEKKHQLFPQKKVKQ